MAQKLKFLGVPVYMNGQNYVVPSLSFADFKAHFEFLTAKPDVEGTKLFEYIERFVPVAGLAIRRNYPDVTDEQLAGWVDLHTASILREAIQAASGLTLVSEGE